MSQAAKQFHVTQGDQFLFISVYWYYIMEFPMNRNPINTCLHHHWSVPQCMFRRTMTPPLSITVQSCNVVISTSKQPMHTRFGEQQHHMLVRFPNLVVDWLTFIHCSSWFIVFLAKSSCEIISFSSCVHTFPKYPLVI